MDLTESGSAEIVQAVEPAAAYELVVDQLRRAIHLGKFVPGEKLPSERLLAERLGVSRVTVREALRVLQGEGYVTSRRGSTGGSIVTSLEEPMGQAIARMKERVEDLENVLVFRVANECASASLAAARRDDGDLRRLEESIRAMEEAGEDFTEFRRTDSAFHLGVAAAARNARLREAIEEARAALFLPMDAVNKTTVPASIRHHRRILKAIEAGDPGRAERMMREHLEAAHQEILETIRHL